MKLSVVLSVHNEEKLIEDALKSICQLANEIIIVNNESTDNTVIICKKYTKNIFEHKNNPLVLNQAKNYGFSKASSDWILSLDADERVSPELAIEIKNVLSNSSVSGYWFPRKNKIFEKWLTGGIWWPDYQLRLFRKEKGIFPAKHNHEFLKIEGKTEYFKNPLQHYSYTSIKQYVNKFMFTYLENEVHNQIAAGKKVKWYDAIRMPTSDFIINFFVREGYRDGLHGLVLALLQACYMFMVFATIWEKQGCPSYESRNFVNETTREFKRSVDEYRHWYWLSKNNFIFRAARKTKRTIISFINNKLNGNIQMP